MIKYSSFSSKTNLLFSIVCGNNACFYDSINCFPKIFRKVTLGLLLYLFSTVLISKHHWADFVLSHFGDSLDIMK